MLRRGDSSIAASCAATPVLLLLLMVSLRGNMCRFAQLSNNGRSWRMLKRLVTSVLGL